MHNGFYLVCRHVAQYIERRDEGVKSDWEDVFLCAGASEGIRVSFRIEKRKIQHNSNIHVSVLRPFSNYSPTPIDLRGAPNPVS